MAELRYRTVDLHLHTTRSDGYLTPTELVRLLVSRGISIAALTDHDSTEGLDEAFAEASKYPELKLIAGIGFVAIGSVSYTHLTLPTNREV